MCILVLFNKSSIFLQFNRIIYVSLFSYRFRTRKSQSILTTRGTATVPPLCRRRPATKSPTCGKMAMAIWTMCTVRVMAPWVSRMVMRTTASLDPWTWRWARRSSGRCWHSAKNTTRRKSRSASRINSTSCRNCRRVLVPLLWLGNPSFLYSFLFRRHRRRALDDDDDGFLSII